MSRKLPLPSSNKVYVCPFVNVPVTEPGFIRSPTSKYGAIKHDADLYKFLTGKSNKEPYYYTKKDDWDWQDWNVDDLP